MGELTAIEWTRRRRADGTLMPGYTFNGWIGCSKYSEECEHCYAEVETFPRVQRAAGRELWGVGGERHRTALAYWRRPLAWNMRAAAAGEQHLVFAQSLSDVFEDRRDLDPWRADLFRLVEGTPHLDWLILTKRAENMVRLAPERWRGGWPRNAWAGVSVGHPKRVGRIDHLRMVPAYRRFVSAEPLLADLGELDLTGIDQVIAGGESVPQAPDRARPMPPAALRSLRDQAIGQGAKFFFKQWGQSSPDLGLVRHKREAGRTLDGREWTEIPEDGNQWAFSHLLNMSIAEDNRPPLGLFATVLKNGTNSGTMLRCPYAGAAGDRLWVRETWRPCGLLSECTSAADIRYAASVNEAEWAINKWTPSIHMPRWASRLTLEVTGVRVERLQSISRDDAQAEGIPQTGGEAHALGLYDMHKQPGHEWDNRTSVENYAKLWDSINGKRADWASNPFVWVVSFRRIP